MSIDPEARELCLTWFPLFEQRLLPVAGGLLDQSNWFLEAMEFVRNERRAVLNEARRQRHAHHA